MATDNIWVWQIVTFEPSSASETLPSMQPEIDVVGFDVEDAEQHHVGKVDEATYETGSAYLVVDTGFWIFGKKRLLPAGVVSAIDAPERRIRLSVTKDEIKEAPDYEELQREASESRDSVANHYAGLRGDPLAPTPGIEHRD